VTTIAERRRLLMEQHERQADAVKFQSIAVIGGSVEDALRRLNEELSRELALLNKEAGANGSWG